MNNPPAPGVATDYRGRLLLDRYSSVLSRLPLRRQVSLADPRSRDAEVWNTFRTLAQLDPALWLPRLMALGRLDQIPGPDELAAGIGLTLWKRIKPPPERLAWLHRRALRGMLRPPVGRKRKGRVVPLSQLREELKARARRRLPLEDPVEVDAIVKCSGTVLFVEIPGPEKSPDEPADSDAERPYLVRLIDAGISYAEARSRARRAPVGFSLLVLPVRPESEDAWSRALRPLATSPARLRAALPHRSDAFDPSTLVREMGIGSWSGLRGLLSSLRREVSDPLGAMLLDSLLHRGRRPPVPSAS